MYSEPLDRRRRQDTVNVPTFRVENEYGTEELPQYFQVTVSVMEAKNLAWHNPNSKNSFIIIGLDKKKYRSNVKKNISEPKFNQSFLFDLYISLHELRSLNVWLAVMEPRHCGPARLLGEAAIPLSVVWLQLHHQIYHKWIQLTPPRNLIPGLVGYLKVDVTINLRGDTKAMPLSLMREDSESNILIPLAPEQQRAKYLIIVYGVLGLYGGVRHIERKQMKPPNSYVKITFCGLMVKTSVQLKSNNPTFSEQISIVEIFPNICHTIKLDVCSAGGRYNKVLGSTSLDLNHVSHEGENGFLPTFGPSLLHMYNSSSHYYGAMVEDGPFHCGSLLVSLNTVVPYNQQSLRSVNVEPVPNVKLENLWAMENFCVFCPVLEVSMLDDNICGKSCGIALTMADIGIDGGNDGGSRKLHYTGSIDVIRSKEPYGIINFSCQPVLQLACRLPDFRFSIYRNNMIRNIVDTLESSVSDVEIRLKSLKYSSPEALIGELDMVIENVGADICKFLDSIQVSHDSGEKDTKPVRLIVTELDQKQLTLQKDVMESIYQQIIKRHKTDSRFNLPKVGEKHETTKKGVKYLIATMRLIAENLKNIISKISDGWPDIVLWLVYNGSRVAYSRITTNDILFSTTPEQCGRNCGRIRTLLMKPTKCLKHSNVMICPCNCIAGKIEIMLWMGLHTEMQYFEGFLPSGINLRMKNYEMMIRSNALMLQCRIFVSKAKLSTSDLNANFSNIFLRANVLSAVQETKPVPKAIAIWNQILKFQKVIQSSPDRVIKFPPSVTVEVYLSERSERMLIGYLQVAPVVNDNPLIEHAPKMMWRDIWRGDVCVGRVLLSAQHLLVPEKVIKSTVYSFSDGSHEADTKNCEISGDVLDTLPCSLMPRSASYKIDVYWWGLRDVEITRKPCVALEIDDLVIKSDIIGDKKINSNFPNGRSSHTFEAVIESTSYSLLNIRLYDSGTFGRTIFLGTNAVKDSKKFIVDWLPKNEREASLKSASIFSTEFVPIGNGSYVRKNRSIGERCDVNSVISTGSLESSTQCKSKRSAWARYFSRKEPCEEEIVLLPMFAKEREVISQNKHETIDQNEWWFRYYGSLKGFNEDKVSVSSGKITIYDSELEIQPGFSKFKDWCSSIKLYNGKKTGIPERDENFYVGLLKVGIAIYKWPPPENTVAVSCEGVRLNNGYFDNLPNNEPTQYLVRVYLIKGVDLKKKNFTGNLNPYAVLSCGKKELSDRKGFARNNTDPVFGRMYELRCSLPEDYLLKVSLYDRDSVQPDELIGTTAIDLEDRVYTKHRAGISLSTEYKLTGLYTWRDIMKPSEILEDLCERNHLPGPLYPNDSTVVVNGVEYSDGDKDKAYGTKSEQKERICLSLLHQWHTLPICGYKLVPEHVETRTLFSPERPGLEQGKIQMWIDIFPLDTKAYLPPPVDITPRNPEDYELRLVIWDVKEIRYESCSSTDKLPDMFVRAWIGSSSQAQDTDIHCSCAYAEASFNWRMVFDLKYEHVEKKILVKEKDPFTEYEQRVSPLLVVQLMESNAGTSDDFLGILSMSLNALPRGEISAHKCSLQAMEESHKVNLFALRSVRGWWPLWTADMRNEDKVMAGAINIEMTLLPKDKAISMPVGVGRSAPNALPDPKRSRTKNSYFKLSVDNFCFPLNFKMLAAILLILTLIAVYLDVFSSLDGTDWISEDADLINVSPQKYVKILRPLN